jgi:endonuclease I
MNASSLGQIEIDPRPCELCGLTIDRHNMVDDGDGPLFFCPDLPLEEMTLLEMERRAELIRREEVAAMVEQWERADPRDAWRHTGEPAPPAGVRNSDISAKPASATRHYCSPQATIKAFWYVAGLNDADYLKRWLAQHPRDVETLQKLWEAKHAGA